MCSPLTVQTSPLLDLQVLEWGAAQTFAGLGARPNRPDAGRGQTELGVPFPAASCSKKNRESTDKAEMVERLRELAEARRASRRGLEHAAHRLSALSDIAGLPTSCLERLNPVVGPREVVPLCLAKSSTSKFQSLSVGVHEFKLTWYSPP